jgi:RNA polymerase sigma-70 factor, ECF subfamily
VNPPTFATLETCLAPREREPEAGGVVACRKAATQRTMRADTDSAETEPGSPLALAPTAEGLAAIVARIAARDQSALEQLYDSTGSRLYALATAILRVRQDAEEVVCDTYGQAWAEADRYDPARASVMGWLMMICRSRALDLLRRRRSAALAVDVEAAAGIEDPNPGPAALLALVEQGSRVHAALARLQPERRELITMAFLQGLSHAEIAARTGLPLGTVKSQVRRGLLQMREELEDLESR